MSTLNKDAADIIARACRRELSHEKVARFYGIARPLVDLYLTGGDCGSLTARKVIRVEIARLNAEKRGEKRFFPSDNDRYKGTR